MTPVTCVGHLPFSPLALKATYVSLPPRPPSYRRTLCLLGSNLSDGGRDVMSIG
jgi:hypothetical protein